MSASQQTFSDTPRASVEQKSVDSQVPPSSQLDREAELWLPPQSQLSTIHAGRAKPIPASKPSTTLPAMQPIRSQQPSSHRGQVFIDLGSDDEDAAPAPVFSSATVAHAPMPFEPPTSAPIPSAPMPPAPNSPLDTRQAIAAARLKHFEKKVHETIDLTLDD